MKKEQRERFLKAIEGGHDPEAAAIGAGLPLSVIEQPSLKKAIDDALRVGAALLRSRIMEIALGQADGDVPALERALARREKQTDGDKVEVVVRQFVDPNPCARCGHKPEIAGIAAARKYPKLSDPPIPVNVVDEAAKLNPEVPSALDNTERAQPRGRRAAFRELIEGGNNVVEIPRS